MPLAAILGLAVTLIQNGPQWIAFVEQTVALLKDGNITDEQLATMWQNAVTASAAAEAKWKTAGAA